MSSKKLINLSNLQKFLSKLNEKFALKKAMKGISEDFEGNIIIGEEGLVPTPNENSKGKFLRSDGEWALPSETAVYDSMTIEEGVAGVSKVDRVINAKNLKQIVNSDGFLTSLDSSKLTGVINIENLPQGALERILIVSSKEERLTLSDTEVQLGDVVKEADTGLMYYVINTEKLNSEEGYTQFTAGSASSVPWSGVTDKPLIPTKTSELTNDSDFAIDNDVVHTSGNETIDGTKTFTGGVTLSSTAKMTVNHAKVVKGTNPSSTQFWQIFNCDKNGADWRKNTLSIIEGALDANGKSSIYFRACKNEANSTTNSTLSVVYDSANNKTWAECPTPDANSNDKKIATTAWVTAKGYLTSHQSLSNYSTLANTVKSISIRGKTITVTPGSGDAYTLTTQDTTYSNFVKSGSGAKAGLVPSPGTTAGTTKYLREDGTWQVPPDHTYTVNNATLTIQKNGSNVATFTANSSSNKTANITVPTKVSELTNDSNFVNSTQLAAKADDADVVHKTGDEDINGTKSFKTMPKIAGAYLGNEASTNERSCLYLTSNRDTTDTSGAYLVRFRQNKAQGALEGVSYISQDILENGTRYPRVLVSGLAFGSDFTPSYYYLSSQSSMPSQLGRENLPWSKAFLTDCSIDNTLEVKGDVWVGGDQLTITSDETEVFTGRRVSWAKNADTLPPKPYNLNIGLGSNNSMSWANRIGGFRASLQTTGDVETAMYAHDTTGASKGQGMIGVYYRRATDTYETIAPTPPAGDNSTQIATTAWVTAKDNNVVHKAGNETVKGVKTFTRDESNAAIALAHGSFKKGDASDVRVACLYSGDGTSYANSLNVYDVGTSDGGNITSTSITSIENTAGESGASKRTSLQIVYHKNPTDGRKQYATLSGDFLPSSNNTYILGSSSFKWKSIYGNLVGNADSSTYLTAQENSAMPTETTALSKVGMYHQKLYNDTGYPIKYGNLINVQMKDVGGSGQLLLGWSGTSGATENIYYRNKKDTADAKWSDWRQIAFVEDLESKCKCLPLKGGTLTGKLTLKQTSLAMSVKDSNSETIRTNDVLLAKSSNTEYGLNIGLGGLGNTVVGAGESVVEQLNELDGNSQENLFLTADNGIYFKVGANTFENAKSVSLSATAEMSGLAKVTSTSFVGGLKGNADTATQFSANKSVTLTGDVTGSASSKGGWSVATTLANSGVTAGTYGPSANVTGNNNSTISVPQITVDAKGRVTSVVNRTLTCKNNTYTVPTKVSQLTNDSKFVNTTQLATKANDADVVHRSGNETIDGTKTFSSKIVGNLQGNADTSTSSTYATTQATTDNSTKIATTAWVRNYVNSVAGSNTVGSSVSAYWSNSSNVTATGQASSSGYYPKCYSEYITKTPTVGTIYSGAQLYTVLNTYASATGSTTGQSGSIKETNTKAQATFSNPINASGKYLCTTANTVKFRAYTAQGSTSAVGASSVVNNSSTKSIFIRVE